jgi:hypothetical protein
MFEMMHHSTNYVEWFKVYFMMLDDFLAMER